MLRHELCSIARANLGTRPRPDLSQVLDGNEANTATDTLLRQSNQGINDAPHSAAITEPLELRGPEYRFGFKWRARSLFSLIDCRTKKKKKKRKRKKEKRHKFIVFYRFTFTARVLYTVYFRCFCLLSKHRFNTNSFNFNTGINSIALVPILICRSNWSIGNYLK